MKRATFTLAWLACGVAWAQSNASKAPDFSGFWELRFDSENVPAASLTPTAAAMKPEDQAQRDTLALRWCNHVGVPFLMTAGPLDIRQGRLEVLIASPSPAIPRHIYIDGRQHVSPEVFDFTTNGNSIGHWEGDTLVVDTIGFNEKGVTSIPGGGYRTESSHLVERFRLLNGGKQLSVIATWEDPKVFARPHTYEYRYYKMPASTRVHDQVCDATDNLRAEFLLKSAK